MAVTIVGNNTPVAGSIVYGDGANYVSTPAGTATQVLTSNGAAAPTWVNQSSLAAGTATSATSATTATNIAGGSAGRIPYQTGAGTTGMIAAGTQGQALISNGTGAPTFGSSIVSMTAQASTSGTNIDFNDIPSWVKRISVVFNGVSLSGTDDILVQLGVSGNYTATYASASAAMASGGNGFSNSTTGFIIRSAAAASITSGTMTICNLTGNVWVAAHSCKQSTTAVQTGGGDVTLSGAVTSIRITDTGTNTFDAGSINVFYE